MKATSQKFVIHQYHATAAKYDAVTNHMKWIRKTLKAVGIEGNIYAHQTGEGLQNLVRPFREVKLWDCDLLLWHHSLGNRHAGKVASVPVPKALVYHNITPAKYFSHDLYLKQLSQLGRTQLALIRDKTVANFADSRYNAEELKKFGFLSTQLLPLMDLKTPQPFLSAPLPSSRWQHSKSLLFVGRMAPHKDQALLIKTIFYLNRYSRRPTQLILIGSEDRVYGLYLRALARQLGVQGQVIFAKDVSSGRLATYYRDADAFLCVSRHEGFCVPLVEAMRADIPVFARKTSAVAETLGSAGLIFQTKNPEEIAEIVSTTLEDDKYVGSILAGQQKRLEEMKAFQNAQVLQEKILTLSDRLRHCSKETFPSIELSR